jgi:carboxylesterase
MKHTSTLLNPHLEGGSFYWEGGPTGVLLCHGFTATTAEVRLLARSLHKQGYTIAGPLLPGHGTTPEDCNRFTWQDWYSSVEQAYFQLASHCQRVIVGGESTGALLVLRLASQHPEADAILCYAPALKLKLNPVKVFLLSLCIPFITSIPKPPSTDNNPWQGYTVQPLKAANELLRLQKVIYPLLPKIQQPILIIQGRLDPTVHEQAPQVVYEKVSSSIKELHWLEHSTHCVILDKERDLAASMTIDFLGRVLVA